MNEYTPDRWAILELKGDNPHYRVLGGWSGSYLYGGSWRLNSGITRHEFEGDCWKFYGSSGSLYRCHADSYGMNTASVGTYNQMKDLHGNSVRLLEDQEWVKDGWNWIIR